MQLLRTWWGTLTFSTIKINYKTPQRLCVRICLSACDNERRIFCKLNFISLWHGAKGMLDSRLKKLERGWSTSATYQQKIYYHYRKFLTFLFHWTAQHLLFSPYARAFGKFLLVELGSLGFGIQNTAQGWIWNPTDDWNPQSKFYWQKKNTIQYLQSRIHGVEFGIQACLWFSCMGQLSE